MQTSEEAASHLHSIVQQYKLEDVFQILALKSGFYS